MRSRVVVLAALLLLVPFLSLSRADPSAYKVVVPQFEKAPKIDGKLENPLWTQGAILNSFTQYEPQEGSVPSEETAVYMGFDKKNLYIAVRCFDSDPRAIRACLTQRDKVEGDDMITVYLDTFNDKKRAFVFQVNPCGVQTDGIFTEDRRMGPGRGYFEFDKSFDTFFHSDASIDNDGFVIEMGIPFKSLRFPHTRPQTWGLQIKREIRRKNEEIFWSPRSRDVNGFLVQAGTVTIDGIIEKGRNLEIMPVMTGLKESGKKFDPQAGLNVKFGLTSNMIADATLNPDFSQIEADMPQVEVNQRYALYYSEKRPFFLEGQDFFATPVDLVYTRKIVNPLWGTKMTGKTGKITLGFLSAFDDSSRAVDLIAEDDDEEEEDEEIPTYKALVNILRLKRDLYPESHIGFILTDKEIHGSWNNASSQYNRIAGVDGHFKFNNNYRFSFQLLGSSSKAEGEKAGFVPAAKFNISRNSRHWRISVDYTHLPPDFDASLGFIRRRDIRSLETRLSYAFLPQNDIIVDIRPTLEYRRIYDFDNTLTDDEIELGCFISGWRGTFFRAEFSTGMERYEGIAFHKDSFRAILDSDPLSWLRGRLAFSFGDGIYYEENPYLGYKTSFEIGLTLKPLTNLRAFYNVENETFYKTKGGEKEYQINILSQRIHYQISRTLSLRLITDYNDYDKELYNSLLLSYELRPGTVFYLGFDDHQEKDDSGIFRKQGRYYFIKFSYWWRI
jgi:hypothetical protein